MVAYAAGVASHDLGLGCFFTGTARLSMEFKMARKKMWVKHDKAVRKLGYRPGPTAEALQRAVNWFQSNGYC